MVKVKVQQPEWDSTTRARTYCARSLSSQAMGKKIERLSYSRKKHHLITAASMIKRWFFFPLHHTIVSLFVSVAGLDTDQTQYVCGFMHTSPIYSLRCFNLPQFTTRYPFVVLLDESQGFFSRSVRGSKSRPPVSR
ncbi:hypothetical protein ElyMa_005958100 [Elysia marginata]|uniref:Uncharacterized protein n=1 Tax=Elysia marginata TaxID=1093978 RepID=A0AAV4GA90_9GAST|nr:hypothetical protein ElyMa_005958100 [Elysia marginata]